MDIEDVMTDHDSRAVAGSSAVAVDPGWMPRVAIRCRRGCWLALRAMRAGALRFVNSNNLTFAASIAYYTLLSLFPFLLLVLDVLGRVAAGPGGAAKDGLIRAIGGAFPSRFDFVLSQLQQLSTSPLNLSVAGTALTLWGAMGVFGAVTTAVNQAWGVQHSYGFLKSKLVAFAMTVAAGALAVTALLLMSAAQVVEAHWFAGVIARFPGLHALSGALSRNAPTPIFVLVVGLIYYYVPNTVVRLRDVWLGAILAGGLWRLAFSGFAWYARDLSRFSIHGSIAAVVLFLVWIYVSAVVLLYGVEVTAAYARLRGDESPVD